ncbi:MAG: TlpA disulfide reductase family protein [Bacteroidales bacterium]
MFRRFLLLISIILLAVACSRNNGFRISGNVKGHAGEYIRLNKVDLNLLVPVDSCKISKSGSFSLKVKQAQPEFYEIGFSKDDFIPLLADQGEKIKISSSGDKIFENFKVSGSPGTSKILMLDSALNVTKSKIEELKKRYDGLTGDPDFKAKEEEINNEYVKLLKDQRMFNIAFILKNLRSFASVKALYQRIDENTYVLYDTRDLQYLKLASDTLNSIYPNSRQAIALKQNFEQEYKQWQMNQVTDLMNTMPASKLDPVLTDINGRRIALSSLKGKVVLLSFWSAAADVCIAENLELKNIYKQYNKKGFEIYQINLDTDKEKWKKAVRYDELPWISVREDDPLNPKNAILYNARILPATYLYDRNGEIIATNIHGRNLERRLSQLFTN